MADTGWKSPGTTANVDRAGEASWVNPNNAKVQNDVLSTCLIEKSSFSDWLRCTNFSMSVPVGATIVGIELEIEKMYQPLPVVYYAIVKDSSVRLRKTAGQVGDDNATAVIWLQGDTDTYYSYGGAADMWGTTWSVAEVNHADFGMDISALNTSADNMAASGIDHVRIKITYTPGVTGPAGIAKVYGIESANIAKKYGVSWSDIKEIYGIS